MKPSGIDWIGEIPETWGTCRLKDYAHICNGRDYSAVLDEDGNYPVMGSGGQFATAREPLYRKESVLLGRKGTVDKPLYINHPFWTVDTMYYTEVSDKECAKYLYYLCTQINFDFYQYGSAVPSMTQRDLYNVRFPHPPLEEQRRIADYLDRKCGQIDTIIARQQDVIEKLKNYKRSLITEAITRGLNPNVSMKPSGIDWIGKIPEHWRVMPLKRVATFAKGLPITKDNLSEHGAPVVSYGQIHSKANNGTHLHSDLIRFVPETYFESNPSSLGRKGDLFLADTSEDYAGIGNAVLVDRETPVFAGYHTIIVRPEEQAYSRYLAYLFLTDAWRSQLCSRASGIKVFSVTQGLLKKTTVILPPTEEVATIAAYLDRKCEQLDATVERKQALIEQLKAYKRSLIYEVVTGEKEV